MNKIKKSAASTKKFVEDHKIAITATVTATLMTAWHISIMNQHNEFLKKHDLYDEYYYTFEDGE